MKSCPKCGAENLITAASCRMCATPIETPGELLGVRADTPLAEQIPPTVIISGQEPAHQHAPASSYAGHVICPACQAVNEKDWAFCQECGNKLPPHNEPASHQSEAASQPSESEAASHTSAAEDATEEFQAAAEDHSSVKTAPPTRDSVAYQTTEHEISFAGQARGTSAASGDVPSTASPLRAPDNEQSANEQAALRPASTVSKPEQEARLTCNSCGAKGGTGALFCSACGSPLSPNAEAAKQETVETKPRASLLLINEGGRIGEAFPLDREVTIIGRNEGEVIFPNDGYVSSRHARVIERDGRFFLVDENSRNGTFIRISGEVELKHGETFLIGRQVIRFDKPF